jgi:hypothetical protein
LTSGPLSADCQHAATPLRGDRAGDNIVIRYGDDAADECVDRPQREESRDRARSGPIARRCHQARHADQAGDAPEGADHVERQTAAAWLPDLEAELFSFPHARYDDQVDAIVQFLEWVSRPLAEVRIRRL